jgi:hypothetical protein
MANVIVLACSIFSTLVYIMLTIYNVINYKSLCVELKYIAIATQIIMLIPICLQWITFFTMGAK